MKWDTVFVDLERRFALEVEKESGRTFLSIPVSNTLTDYLEWYELDAQTFERYRANPTLAIEFADQCERREMDHLLLLPPGTDRGLGQLISWAGRLTAVPSSQAGESGGPARCGDQGGRGLTVPDGDPGTALPTHGSPHAPPSFTVATPPGPVDFRAGLALPRRDVAEEPFSHAVGLLFAPSTRGAV